MSKRKGLSKDEKKVKVLEIFHEKKEPFPIPDLEPYAKKKNVVVQTVKEVVQELADDGEVMFDKIGVTTFYWSFPSQTGHARRKRIQELQQSVDGHKKKLHDLEKEREKLIAERQETDARRLKLQRLEELQQRAKILREELQKHSDSDPAVLEAIQEDAREAAIAANRWGDNMDSLRSWLKNQMNVKIDEINKQFDLPDEIEYVPID